MFLREVTELPVNSTKSDIAACAVSFVSQSGEPNFRGELGTTSELPVFVSFGTLFDPGELILGATGKTISLSSFINSGAVCSISLGSRALTNVSDRIR